MEMTTVKTVAVFAIIFGCFAVLYPKIFHPMFLHMLGSAPKKPTADDITVNRVPPHLRHPSSSHVRSESPMDDIGKHMRPGPHPGLRAAAEMKKQAATQGGGGKGIMSVVLPMYAVGIVIYLIYTLSKVFGKKEKAPEGELLSNNPFAEIRYDAEKKKFMYGNEDDEESDPEVRQLRQKRAKQRDLERLLLKADDKHLSDLDMTQLKRRLLETEAQMNRILQAMETMQDQVETATDRLSQEEVGALKSFFMGQGNGLDGEGDLTKMSVDSSPDMDSYEIIAGNKQNLPGDSGSEGSRGEFNEDSDIENIGVLDGEIDICQRIVAKVKPLESENIESEGSVGCEEEVDELQCDEEEEQCLGDGQVVEHVGRDVSGKEGEEEDTEDHVEDIPTASVDDSLEELHADLRKRIPAPEMARTNNSDD